LDARNGRFCVTPEYPSGIYAYFVTLDASLTPVFPYTFFGTYYGVVQTGNTGPGSGHNVPGEPVTTYNPSGISEHQDEINFSVYPNPASDVTAVFVMPSAINNSSVTITNSLGQVVLSRELIQPGINYFFDIGNLEGGVYSVNIRNGEISGSRKLVVVR
jgi:hypothetical protein